MRLRTAIPIDLNDRTALGAALVAALRMVCDPRKAVLFGSRATGRARDDSDIDLLVVHDRADWATRARHLEASRIERALPQFARGVDVILVTSDEAARWGRWKNHVVGQALAEGVVLYERPSP